MHSAPEWASEYRSTVKYNKYSNAIQLEHVLDISLSTPFLSRHNCDRACVFRHGLPRHIPLRLKVLSLEHVLIAHTEGL